VTAADPSEERIREAVELVEHQFAIGYDIRRYPHRFVQALDDLGLMATTEERAWRDREDGTVSLPVPWRPTCHPALEDVRRYVTPWEVVPNGGE
jgi:hypothetical protein